MEEKRHRSHKLRWAISGFALAAMLGFSFDLFVPTVSADTVDLSTSAPNSAEIMVAYQNAFRNVAQAVLPVVVKIDVVNVIEHPIQRLGSPLDFLFGPRNDQENGDGTEAETREFRSPSLGSGVIVRRAGNNVYVLTNSHVVGEAEEITINLHDDRSFEGSLVGKDERRDLALVVFETREQVPIADLGNSDEVQVGDWAFAVGNPLGFESTITAGIISALGRRPEPGTSGFTGLTDYIQTDAAINQGNSGGALVNLNGEVIGINTWIASQSGGNIGLGFAIPINNARRAIDEFIDYGAVQYGWLGIRFGGVISDEVASSLGLGDEMGALVGSVFTSSPAALAGIQPGDVVREISGERIDDWNELVNIVADIAPGDSTTFRIWRSGRTLTRRVEITIRDEAAETAESWPGFIVLPLTDEIRGSLDLKDEPGQVVVTGVDPGTPAADAGIRQGDIIREIGDTEVDDLAEFYRLMNEQSDGEYVFRMVRQGREFLIGLVR